MTIRNNFKIIIINKKLILKYIKNLIKILFLNLMINKIIKLFVHKWSSIYFNKIKFFSNFKAKSIKWTIKNTYYHLFNHITRISNIQSIIVTALFNFYWMNNRYILIKFMNV